MKKLEQYQQQTVTEEEWRERRDALAREARAWLADFEKRDQWNAITLTGTIATIAHMAYHLGAIRQIARAAVGPPEPGA